MVAKTKVVSLGVPSSSVKCAAASSVVITEDYLKGSALVKSKLVKNPTKVVLSSETVVENFSH